MHFLTSLIKFALWNWGRPKRLKLFNKEAGRGHGGSVPGRPNGILLGYNPLESIAGIKKIKILGAAKRSLKGSLYLE